MDKHWHLIILTALLAVINVTKAMAATVTPAQHTVTVDPTVDSLTASALSAYTPVPSMVYYAITDDYQAGTLHVVSVAGLPSTSDPNSWDIGEAVWIGMVAVDTSDSSYAVEGEAAFDTMTSSIFPGGGGSSQVPLFPFQPGTRAMYGPRGVHEVGFGLTSWIAVDWLSGTDLGDKAAPNLVYGSETAQISYVCRDGGQIAVRAGNFLYAHLVDNSTLDIGKTIYRGVSFAEMVMGDSNTACGWTQQQPNHYHVHWGFAVPQGADALRFEDWTFMVADSQFYKGDQVVGVGDWMWASGTASDGGIQPPSLDDGNLWSGIVTGIVNASSSLLPVFPSENVELGQTYISAAAAAVRAFYILTTTHLRLNVALWVFGIIVLLEPVRLIYAVYMMIKKLIPILG